MKLFWKIFFIIQWIIFCGLIFYLSSLPNVEFLPKSIIDRDKLLHLIGFFFYGISTQLFINTICINQKKSSRIFYVLIIGIIYGLTDELHQSFVPGRTSDIYDFLVDLIGIILSLCLFNLILKALNKFKESSNAKIS